jgi:hypothetical protein
MTGKNTGGTRNGKKKKMVRSSTALRVGFLVSRTLAHDGRAKPRTQIVGQLVKFRVAIDFDSLASGIADHIAVVTPRQVIVEFGLGPGVEHAIEVVGQLV